MNRTLVDSVRTLFGRRPLPCQDAYSYIHRSCSVARLVDVKESRRIFGSQAGFLFGKATGADLSDILRLRCPSFCSFHMDRAYPCSRICWAKRRGLIGSSLLNAIARGRRGCRSMQHRYDRYDCAAPELGRWPMRLRSCSRCPADLPELFIATKCETLKKGPLPSGALSASYERRAR